MRPHMLHISVRRFDVNQHLPLPSYQTAMAAGMDVCAAVTEPVLLQPGTVTLVPTGLAIAVPEGFEAQLRPRSGIATRHTILIPNSPATIDADYRGEIFVPLLNLGVEPFLVTRGMRIAQMIIAPVCRAQWREVGVLDTSERGDKGFGHTGV